MLVLILIFQKNKTPDPTWDWWYLVAKQMSNVSSASAGCSSCNYHWCSHSSWVQLQSSWCKQDAQKRFTWSTVREMVIMLVYWSSFLVLWTILELSIEFYMYFHKLSRQTPPHQVADGQWMKYFSASKNSGKSLMMVLVNTPSRPPERMLRQ